MIRYLKLHKKMKLCLDSGYSKVSELWFKEYNWFDFIEKRKSRFYLTNQRSQVSMWSLHALLTLTMLVIVQIVAAILAYCYWSTRLPSIGIVRSKTRSKPALLAPNSVQ